MRAFAPHVREEQPGAVHHGEPAIQIGRIQIDLYNNPRLSEDEELTTEAGVGVFFGAE